MDRVDQVEAELQVLKGQIKETLSDIEEYILTYADNPFAWNAIASNGNGHTRNVSAQMTGHDVPGEVAEDGRPGQNDRTDSLVPRDGDPEQDDSSNLSDDTIEAQEQRVDSRVSKLDESSHRENAPFGANGLNEAERGDRARSFGAEPLDEIGARRFDIHGETRSPESWSPFRGLNGNHAVNSNDSPAEQRSHRTAPGNSRSARERGLRSEEVEALIRWLTESREGPAPAVASGSLSGSRSNWTPDDLTRGTVPSAPGSRLGEPAESASDGLELGMDVIAVLGTWTAKALKRLGQPRLKNLLRLYAEIGGISPKTESILQSLADLEDAPACKEGVGLEESLRCLAELDDTVWRLRSKRPTTALLMSRLDDSSPAA